MTGSPAGAFGTFRTTSGARWVHRARRHALKLSDDGIAANIDQAVWVRLRQNRESPAHVKEQMGHSSVKITIDTYGHLIRGAHKAAVGRLDRGECKWLKL